MLELINAHVWPAIECGNRFVMMVFCYVRALGSFTLHNSVRCVACSSTLRHLMEIFLVSFLSQYPQFIQSHLLPRSVELTPLYRQQSC
jgi:hypothetical protein